MHQLLKFFIYLVRLLQRSMPEYWVSRCRKYNVKDNYRIFEYFCVKSLNDFKILKKFLILNFYKRMLFSFSYASNFFVSCTKSMSPLWSMSVCGYWLRPNFLLPFFMFGCLNMKWLIAFFNNFSNVRYFVQVHDRWCTKNRKEC